MDENNQENAEQKVVNEENVQSVNTPQNEEAKQETVGADGYTSKEKEDGKVMAILSYIGVLSLIPYLAEKENKWVRFHALQGINLFIIEAINIVISFVPLIGGLVSSIIWLGILFISIMGIINVCNGEAKELPIVSNIKFIKQ